MGLSWPSPWDGVTLDSGTGVAMGGLIGTATLGTIDPGNDSVIEIPWTTGIPDGAMFTDSTSTHFCLLARIETSPVYPFGMDIPEETANTPGASDVLATNVLNNNKIAWRNVVIDTPPPNKRRRIPPVIFRFPVLGANYGLAAGTFRYAVETVDRDGIVSPMKGEVRIRAAGFSLLRLIECVIEEFFRHLGDGCFRLFDLARGIENVRLHPGESLPFTVEFEPADEVQDFAVRVLQYGVVDGREKLIGGQTFVVGSVEGFPVRETDS
jgi:hypothetical protein